MDHAREAAASAAPDPSLPAIEVIGLWKAFGALEVLRGLDLRVERGTTCAILGTSGSGKTVLLKHLAGLLKPDRGAVRIDGEDLVPMGPVELRRVREKIGVLFQGGALFDSLSAFENVAFPLREHTRMSEAEIAVQVRQTLALMDLPGVEALFPSSLSGGMQKRLALARAVVQRPRLMLYDDPTAGLDPVTTAHVVEMIRSARAQLGVTSVVMTNDLAVAFELADTVGFLSGGELLGFGKPEQFRASLLPDVRALLHTWEELRGDAAST